MGTTTNGLERMRERQRRAGVVTVRPMYPPARPKMDAAERLAVVLDVCGVTPRCREVLALRVGGGAISEVADVLGVSKHRVREAEGEALARLGLRGRTVDGIIQASQRAGVRTGDGDYHEDMHETRARAKKYREPWERRHEKAVAAFLRARS